MTAPVDADPFEGLQPLGADFGVFLTRVYATLAGGLALSAGVAWSVATLEPLRRVFFVVAPDGGYGLTLLGMVLAFAPLVVLMGAGFRHRALSASGASAMYWSIAALFGGSMAVLALTYAGTALTSTFLVTAGAFAGLSVAGLAAKRSLSGLGAFLSMALIGLILALAVSFFLDSPVLTLGLNILGVLIFAGLTAADSQQLRRVYESAEDPEALGAAVSYGALTLYLNFLNLFQLLLTFTSRRGRR